MPKNVIAAAFAISLATCLPANADIINVTVTGTVLSGSDVTGVFGLRGLLLTSRPYTANFVFDSSIGATGYGTGVSIGQYLTSGSDYQYPSAALSASITITGHTEALNTAAQAMLQIYNNWIFVDIIGSSSDNDRIRFNLTSSALHFPTSFDTSFTYNVVAGDGTSGLFNVKDDCCTIDATGGNLRIQTLTLTNNGIASVPGPIVGAGIPGVLAMFGFGTWKWRRKLAMVFLTPRT